MNGRFAPVRLQAVATLALLAPWAAAHAEVAGAPAEGPWRFGLSIYGYLPSLSSGASVPTSPGGATIDVNASKIVDSLKFTFMGSLDATNGRYGFFTDFIYLDLGGDKQFSRDFTINHRPIPIGTSADLDWGLKGVIWTLGGQYRIPTDPRWRLDAVAGARLFSLEPSLSWSIHGDLGGIAPYARNGQAGSTQHVWDGIVGAKGRYAINDRWSVPFYADVGAGESRLTWQAAAGVSYAFDWGELTGMWRYISYEFKSGSPVHDIKLNGPMIGATFRW
ncbi:hypothetical protein WKW79_23785 [Variovorax robiniae]|uniref:Outer membrane protein beta-barrel domain-containing protein n=1 Tax=Variovorax robiniae TaxID=1836199 RepID=A0ABU8XF15_9BURK